MRPTTIRDARKLNLLPSVTTILAVPAKPGLDRWKTDQLIQAILKNPGPRLDLSKSKEQYDKQVDNWKRTVLHEGDGKRNEAAEAGSQIHDLLEKYFNTGDINEEKAGILVPVIEKIHQEFDYMWAEPEVSFASKDGYGGKIDLLLDDNILIDFKTKSKDEIGKEVLTDDYFMQLAAYRIGLDLPKLKCYNLFISTTKPGVLFLHQWKEEDLDRGYKMFKCLLRYWQLSNTYNSAF